MKKEMKIVLPFYKIAYAVSFVVILSLIRGVVFTNEIGLSIEAPFAISNKKENLLHHAANNDTGIFFITACCFRLRIVFCVSKTSHTSGNGK